MARTRGSSAPSSAAIERGADHFERPSAKTIWKIGRSAGNRFGLPCAYAFA